MNAEIVPAVTVLTPPECWQELRRAEVGRLAVSIAGHPDIFPINFVVDHASVVFRSAEGTKLAAAVLGRGVAFEVDGYEPGLGEAWSVVGEGQGREIEGLTTCSRRSTCRCSRGRRRPSTASCGSCPPRSPVADSRWSTERVGAPTTPSRRGASE